MPLSSPLCLHPQALETTGEHRLGAGETVGGNDHFRASAVAKFCLDGEPRDRDLESYGAASLLRDLEDGILISMRGLVKLTCVLVLAALGMPGCDCSGGIEVASNPDAEPVPAVCGDSELGAGEECDSGDLRSDTLANECRLDCRLPWCGDGVVDLGEECETALTPSCSTTCRVDTSAFLALKISEDMEPRSVESMRSITPFDDSGRVILMVEGAGSAELAIVNGDGTGRIRLSPIAPKGASIRNLLVAPTQDRVLYLSNHLNLAEPAIYSVRSNGTGLMRLNPETLEGGGVVAFWLSPDETQVIYIANEEDPTKSELFSIRLDGTGHVKLNGPLPDYGQVRSYSTYTHSVNPKFSPDSSKVLFQADVAVEGARELFVADVEGGGLLRLSADMVTGGQVGDAGYDWSFAVSPDSSGVVYLADQETDDVMELFYVKLDGSGQRKLNRPLVADTSVDCGGFEVSYCSFAASGDFLYYNAQHEGYDPWRLLAVNVADGELLELSDGARIANFELTPDEARVVYRALEGLLVVNLDGSNRTLVNGPVVEGGRVFAGYKITPDSQKLIFAGEIDTVGVAEIYAASLDGSGTVKLNSETTGMVESDFAISADSSAVVFRARTDASQPHDLFVVQTDGGNLTQVTEDPWPTGARGIRSVAWYQEGASSRLLFAADFTQVERYEAVSTNTVGGDRITLLSELVTATDVVRFDTTPNSSHVVYVTGVDTGFLSTLSEIHTVASDGNNDVLIDSYPKTAAAQRYTLHLSPDSNHLAYEAYERLASHALFTCEMDGSAKLKIAPVADTDSAYRARFTPDSQRLLYLEYGAAGGNLMSSLLDGQRAQINGDLVTGGGVVIVNAASSQVAANSSRVAYIADEEVKNQYDVYATDPDGGNHVKISRDGGGVYHGTALNYHFSPDASRVVYLAEHDTPGVSELYAAVPDGTGVTKISGPMVNGGDVATTSTDVAFKITADSSKVVYIADQDTDQLREIYSVGLDGANGVKLSGTPVEGGGLGYSRAPYLLSADSSRVVYLSRQDEPDVWELYSVGLDGSGLVKLNGTMVEGGDVMQPGNFAISPDSLYLVYLADQQVDGKNELFAARLDGTDKHALTSFADERDVTKFAILGDSSVVFLADGESDEVVEVFSVQIDGSGLRRLAPALPTGRTTTEFSVLADESAVLLRADAIEHGVFELFSVSLL